MGVWVGPGIFFTDKAAVNIHAQGFEQTCSFIYLGVKQPGHNLDRCSTF